MSSQPVTQSADKTPETSPGPEVKPGAAPGSPETPAKKKGGIMKLLGIGAGVLAVGGIAAAGLYYGKVIPGFQPSEELKGAAQETSQSGSMEEDLSGGTAQTTASQTSELNGTQQTQELEGITQIALTACPQGQVKDPVSNLCVCDINNNYFQITLQDAFSQPVSGQAAVSCTTCAALSDQILKLGKSTNPVDVNLKNELSALAKQNNCTPCAAFDDRIANALQKKNWNEYFDLVVEKSNDQTCGRTLSTCDSLKWQLLFLNDLRSKAGKDAATTAEELAKLKEKQQTIEDDLGTNTACYTLESLCSELKTMYEPQPQAVTLTQQEDAPMIGTTPLIGGEETTAPASPKEETMMEGETGELSTTEVQPAGTTTRQISLEDGTSVDLGTISNTKLFSTEFYLMHCPVGGSAVAPSSTPAAPLTDTAEPVEAPKKVKRVQ